MIRDTVPAHRKFLAEYTLDHGRVLLVRLTPNVSSASKMRHAPRKEDRVPTMTDPVSEASVELKMFLKTFPVPITAAATHMMPTEIPPTI